MPELHNGSISPSNGSPSNRSPGKRSPSNGSPSKRSVGVELDLRAGAARVKRIVREGCQSLLGDVPRSTWNRITPGNSDNRVLTLASLCTS